MKIDIKNQETAEVRSIVRGHGKGDILETFLKEELADIPENTKRLWEIQCTGGGTIRHTNTEKVKKISIYSYPGYGKSDMKYKDLQKAKEIITRDKDYKDYQVYVPLE